MCTGPSRRHCEGLALTPCQPRKVGVWGDSDVELLEWAADAGRVVVTFNVRHFVKLHVEWIQSSRHHAGIIVSQQRSLGDLLRRLVHLSNSLDAQAMRDRLEYLGDW